MRYYVPDMAWNDASQYAGLYSVWDRDAENFVHTASGELYAAPYENAQWTADTMNRNAARKPER